LFLQNVNSQYLKLQTFFKKSNLGIEDSLIEGKLLSENEYEAKGSHKNPICNAPFKGRMNASYEVVFFLF
jgi:hypothetical protein